MENNPDSDDYYDNVSDVLDALNFKVVPREPGDAGVHSCLCNKVKQDEKIKHLTEENTKLKGDISQLERKLENIQKTLSKSRSEVDSIICQKTELNNQLLAKQNEFHAIRNELMKAQAQLKNCQTECSKLEGQVRSREEIISSKSKEIETIISKHAQEIEEHRSTISGLQHRLDEVENLNSELETKVEKLERQNHDLKKQHEDDQNNLKLQTEKTTKLERDLEGSKEKIENLEKNLLESQSRENSLKSKYDTVLEICSNIGRKNEELKTSNSDKQFKIESLERNFKSTFELLAAITEELHRSMNSSGICAISILVHLTNKFMAWKENQKLMPDEDQSVPCQVLDSLFQLLSMNLKRDTQTVTASVFASITENSVESSSQQNLSSNSDTSECTSVIRLDYGRPPQSSPSTATAASMSATPASILQSEQPTTLTVPLVEMEAAVSLQDHCQPSPRNSNSKKCPVCGKGFHTKRGMLLHKRRAHSGRGRKNNIPNSNEDDFQSNNDTNACSDPSICQDKVNPNSKTHTVPGPLQSFSEISENLIVGTSHETVKLQGTTKKRQQGRGVKFQNERSRGSYPCTRCKRNFSRGTALKQHQHSQHCADKAGKKSFLKESQPEIDDTKNISTPETPAVIVKLEHTNEPVGSSMTYNEAIVIHAKDNSKAKKLGYFCTCGMEFTKTNVRDQHIIYKNAVKQFQCPECPLPRLFKSTGILRRHMRNSHGKPYLQRGCRFCGATFDSMKTLIAHQMKEHETRKKITKVDLTIPNHGQALKQKTLKKLSAKPKLQKIKTVAPKIKSSLMAKRKSQEVNQNDTLHSKKAKRRPELNLNVPPSISIPLQKPCNSNNEQTVNALEPHFLLCPPHSPLDGLHSTQTPSPPAPINDSNAEIARNSSTSKESPTTSLAIVAIDQSNCKISGNSRIWVPECSSSRALQQNNKNDKSPKTSESMEDVVAAQKKLSLLGTTIKHVVGTSQSHFGSESSDHENASEGSSKALVLLTPNENTTKNMEIELRSKTSSALKAVVTTPATSF